MKKIDKCGLILCNIQGNLFEESLLHASSSSEIFIRRFMNSKISKEFDNLSFLDDSKTRIDVYASIEVEYGKTEYGKIKYEKEELFWIGYIYRYFSYTYDLSSRQVYKIIKPKELRQAYLAYHTMDCSIAIQRLLEEKNISFDEQTFMLKALQVYKRIIEEEVLLVKISFEEANILLRSFKKQNLYLSENTNFYNSLNRKTQEMVFLKILSAKKNVGVICFKNIKNTESEIEIIFKSRKIEDFCSKVLARACTYAKETLNLKKLYVTITKKKSNICKENGFVLEKDLENTAVFMKIL